MKLTLLIALLSLTLNANAQQDPTIEVTCQYRHFYTDQIGNTVDVSPISTLRSIAQRDDDLELVVNLFKTIGPADFFIHFSFSDIANGPAKRFGTVDIQFNNALSGAGSSFHSIMLYGVNNKMSALFKTNEFNQGGLKVNRLMVECFSVLKK